MKEENYTNKLIFYIISAPLNANALHKKNVLIVYHVNIDHLTAKCVNDYRRRVVEFLTLKPDSKTTSINHIIA